MSAQILAFPPPPHVREAARRCVALVEYLGLDGGAQAEQRLLDAWRRMDEEDRRAFLEAFSGEP